MQNKARVGGEAAPGPERQFQARLEIEEGHRAVLELGPHDSLRGQLQSVAIEGHGAFEVLDPESDEGDAWLHDESEGPGFAPTPV